jgi:hypothetical protein
MNFNIDSKILEKLTHELKKNSYLEVGIFSDDRDANIGSKHELGLDGLSQRSFILFPLIYKQKELLSFFKNPSTHFRYISREGLDKWLKKLLKKSLGIIQESFDTGGFGYWKVLAISTILKKGNDKILIDTEQMMKSMQGFVRTKG